MQTHTEAGAQLQEGQGPVLLLVEDDPSIGNLVRTYLGRHGYRIVWVRTGEEGLAELGRHAVRLVVLDIGLPGMDGFDVCRVIRERSLVPIVMLTARDEEPDRVAGLEVRSARIKAVLRRADRTAARDVMTLGDVVLRRDSHEVTVDGRLVELTPKEFELLGYLMENPGTVFSRDHLLDRVWGMTYPAGTRTVDAHVAQLRRKLDRPELVRTVRGAGYKTARE
jgi:two-component system response regulator RegX3